MTLHQKCGSHCKHVPDFSECVCVSVSGLNLRLCFDQTKHDQVWGASVRLSKQGGGGWVNKNTANRRPKMGLLILHCHASLCVFEMVLFLRYSH